MSFILTNIIKKKIPNWNDQIVNENELLKLCKRIKVRLIEDEIRSKGEYTVYKGVPFIVLNKTLKREMKLWVALHEVGHHLLHSPREHKFSKSIWARMDREANFFAAIALMPTWLITSKTFGEIFEEYNYPKQLIMIRKEIYDTYKI